MTINSDNSTMTTINRQTIVQTIVQTIDYNINTTLTTIIDTITSIGGSTNNPESGDRRGA